MRKTLFIAIVLLAGCNGAAGSGPESDASPAGSGGAASGAGGATGAGGSGGAGSSTAGAVTYEGNIKALLQANCVSCHSGSGASAGIALDSYTSAKNNAVRANGAIQGGSMPPGGALSAANQALFQSWVNAGEPQ